MLNSLARSSARASKRQVGYVCLSCRANSALAEVSPTPPKDLPPPQNNRSVDESHLAGLHGTREEVSLLYRQLRRLKAISKSIPVPTVIGNNDSGFTARYKLDGVEYTTARALSRFDAKGEARAHILKHVRPSLTDTHLSEKLRAQVTQIFEGHAAVLAQAIADDEAARDAPSVEAGQSRPRDSVTKALGKSKKSSNRSEVRKVAKAIGPGARRLNLIRFRKCMTNKNRPPRITSIAESQEIAKFFREAEIRRHRARFAHDSRPRGISRDGMRKIVGKQDNGAKEDAEAEADNSRTSSTKEKPARSRSRVPVEDLKLDKNSQSFQPLQLKPDELDIPTEPVPILQYGLDRVLFNPGVHHLQDPRSRVYNFDPYLEKIVDARNFDFAALDEFRSPSADDTLSSVAEKHKVKYFSSTSAITGALTHLHFMISNFRSLNFSELSAGILSKRGDPMKPVEELWKGDFTNFYKGPQSIYLKPKQGGYAIDKAEDKSTSGLLSFMGQCLEKLFTVPKETFELYKKTTESGSKPEAAGNGYHYTKFDNVLVRSQLDAHDDRLPGTGIFDIKTRAVLPIRMDSLEVNHDTSVNYELKRLHGQFESFEREFHDMGRATMLKYMLQARLGRMDGIFVAYHNIVRMFGFQYLSIPDMDFVLHGQSNRDLGDAELNGSLKILSQIFDRAVEKFPDEPIRLYFDARKARRELMVYVVPATHEEIDQQYINASQRANEYLARLNQFEDESKKDDESEESLTADEQDLNAAEETESVGELSAANAKIVEEVSATDAKARDEDHFEGLESAEGRESDAEPENEADAEAESISTENEGTESTEATVESANEELSRLRDILSLIKKDGDYLWHQYNQDNSIKIQPLLVEDVMRKTELLEKEHEALAIMVKPVRGYGSRKLHSEVKDLALRIAHRHEANAKLLRKAEEGEEEGMQLKDMENARTLEEALKDRSVQRDYAPPERMVAFQVLIQNRVDGQVLGRDESPTNINRHSQWEITHRIEEVTDAHFAQKGWGQMLKTMTTTSMTGWEAKRVRDYYEGSFFQELMRVSRRGKRWRKARDEADKKKGTVVFEPKAKSSSESS